MSNNPRPLLARLSTWTLVALLVVLATLPYMLSVAHRKGAGAESVASRRRQLAANRDALDWMVNHPLPSNVDAFITGPVARRSPTPPAGGLPDNPPAYKLEYHPPRFSRRRITIWLVVGHIWAVALILLVAQILRTVS